MKFLVRFEIFLIKDFYNIKFRVKLKCNFEIDKFIINEIKRREIN